MDADELAALLSLHLLLLTFIADHLSVLTIISELMAIALLVCDIQLVRFLRIVSNVIGFNTGASRCAFFIESSHHHELLLD